jgi:hypothetical protein
MLYILNINKFIGLYNLEYFSTAMLVSLIFKTPLINHEMKLGLQNYAVIMPIKTIASNLIIKDK